MAEDRPTRLDRRRDGLFRQLGLINDGVVYIYCVTGPRGAGHARLPAYLRELLGYASDHPESRRDDALDRLTHPDDLSRIASHRRVLARLGDGQATTFTCRMKHIDGRWRWIEVREQVFSRNRAGQTRRVLGFASDVSERRRLTDSLAGATGALLLAEEHERRRIGRELHDSTAQHLVAIDLSLSLLERRIGEDPVERAIVQDIRSALTSAHREVRTFSYLLHPPNLERVGLEAALNQFLDGFQRRTGLKLCFQVLGPSRVLGQHADLAVFRLVQEALMNVHRHAGAREVDIRLIHRTLETALEVSDDGIGLTTAKIESLLSGESRGVGIASMKARIEGLGGALEILPQARGLLIRAVMPRRRASDALPPLRQLPRGETATPRIAAQESVQD